MYVPSGINSSLSSLEHAVNPNAVIANNVIVQFVSKFFMVVNLFFVALTLFLRIFRCFRKFLWPVYRQKEKRGTLFAILEF